jgi:hypothetical protein
MSNRIITLYYYETTSENNTYWHLTDNKELASQGLNFRTANLDDLDDYGCVGGIFESEIIHVDEGFFEWNSEAITYANGETYGDYEIVSNLKDRALSRMEYLDMKNTDEYEKVSGWNEWRVESFLDSNEQNETLR